MNADLFLTLLFIGCGAAWLLTAVNPIRMTIELLAIVERVLKTAWDMCCDAGPTFMDRWSNPTRRQSETRQAEEVRE